MKEYKCRTECLDDCLAIIASLQPVNAQIKALVGHEYLPDRELIFSYAFDLEYVRKAIIGNTDCHVAAETVALKEDYTGKRISLD